MEFDYDKARAAAERSEVIDTGDAVFHKPTGETWLVAFVDGEYLWWCGWPEGRAKLSDCTLTHKATKDERDRLLKKMAEMNYREDARFRYAQRVLKEAGEL